MSTLQASLGIVTPNAFQILGKGWVLDDAGEFRVYGSPDEHLDSALDPPRSREVTRKARSQVDWEVLTHQWPDSLAKHGAHVLTAIHDALAGHPGCRPSPNPRKPPRIASH